MSKPSLDQKRAAHALACIRKLEGNSEQAANYVSYVKALPASILANGLGQALATELAANDKAHDSLAEHVAGWLLTAPGSPYGSSPRKSDRAKTLLGRIVEGDQRAYFWAQAEAISFVGWLKKLAVAFHGKDAASKQKAQADAS